MVSASQIGTRFRWELLAQIAGAVSSGLLVVILARILDPGGYGLLYLAIAYIGIAEVFSTLGVKGSAARYVAEYKEGDEAQVPYIIQVSFLVMLFLISIVSISVVVFHQYIAELAGEPELGSFLLVGILYLVFGTIHKYCRKLIQGFEAIELSAQLHLIESLSKPIFAVSFVFLGYGALGAFAGYAASVFIGTIIGVFVLYFRFYRKFEKGPIMEPGLGRRFVEYSIPLTATQAAGRINNNLDTVLIGLFLNPTAVSYYVVSKQAVTFIEKPADALGFTLGPTAAAESSAGNTRSLAHVYERAIINVLSLYIPASVGLIVIADPMINLVFGTEYVGAIPVLQTLGIYATLLSINMVISTALDYLGRARSRAILKGITSIMNAGLNVILIPLIGVVGAAIATVTTYSLYAFGTGYMIHSELGFNMNVLLKNVIQICASSVIMAIVVFFLLDFIIGWLSLFVVVSVGAFIYTVLGIMIGIINLREVLSVFK